MKPTPGTIAPGLLDVDDTSLTDDERWMYRCLELAAAGAGCVSPNPLVGAVLVGSDGRVLGKGRHEAYGGSHAEVHAIEEAERTHSADVLRSATLYTNLEPCNHRGKTPPCTDLLLKKKIPELVVGMVDPFPQASGTGLERLRARGVTVRKGVLEHACRRFNEPYLHHLKTGRSLLTLKVAQTLDGAIASRTGDSRWVSGKASRTLVHRWRASTDAVLVGAGTAVSDDPRLTVRHVQGPQPLRIVLDRRGELAGNLKLLSDHHTDRTIAVTSAGTVPAYADSFRERGGTLLHIPEVDGHLDLTALLQRLGKLERAGGRTVQSLLVEAGPGLTTALLGQKLVDRFFLFIAPKLLGGGKPSVMDLGIGQMANAHSFAEHAWKPIGEDMLFAGYCRDV